MGGMIGVIADHAARYTWFTESLTALKPKNTEIRYRVGANRGVSRDSLARECLDEDFDWIFFVDDDQTFPDDVLVRLLSHEQPVVSALIVQRGAPFLPTAYAGFENGKFSPLDLNSVGHDNLVACEGIGTGGLLVRYEVLRQLDDGRPWFLYSEEFGEDLYFSRRLAEVGIRRLVDTGCRIGHILPAAVFPTDGPRDEWRVGIQLADGTKTTIEMDHR